ncbi:hypothetical protein ACWDUK_25380 [Streptomyces cellulosae]
MHRRVFDEYYGHDDMYGCLDDLWADEEFMGEEGTHSILDIQRVVHSTAAPTPLDVEDYGTLRPLTPERVLHHFGTSRPTPVRFAGLLDHARTANRLPPDPEATLLDECRMRWTGVYVLLYADDRAEPTHLGIFGYSGD